MSTKVLITGVTGCLGRNTFYYLKNMDYSCVGIGRNQEIGKVLQEDGLDFHAINLLDMSQMPNEDLQTIFKDVKYVIHCAALSSAWGAWDDFYQANVLATKDMLSLSKKLGVQRFVHVSSPSIYFQFKDQINIEEDKIPKKFVNHYARSKYLAELEVLKYKDSSMEILGIRPRAIFGAWDRAIFPRIMRVAKKGKFIQIGKGSLGDYTYVENVSYALSLCLVSPTQSLNRFYNISNGTPMKINQFIQMVFDQLQHTVKTKQVSWKVISPLTRMIEVLAKLTLSQKEPLMTRYGAAVLHFDQTLNLSQAKQYLGYEPQVSLHEGLQQFCKWYESKETQ